MRSATADLAASMRVAPSGKLAFMLPEASRTRATLRPSSACETLASAAPSISAEAAAELFAMARNMDVLRSSEKIDWNPPSGTAKWNRHMCVVPGSSGCGRNSGCREDGCRRTIEPTNQQTLSAYGLKRADTV